MWPTFDTSQGLSQGARPARIVAFEGAGRDGHLVQTFTTESEHDDLSASEYATSIAALDNWVRTGRKPTPQSIADSCTTFDSTYGSGGFHDPDYRPASYHTRVRPPAGESRPDRGCRGDP